MEINWKVVQLERTNDNAQGVVTVHWTAKLVDNDYSASTYGTTSHTPDSTTDNFVPFDQLTEDTVLEWVFEQIGKDTIEVALATQIEAKKAPAVVSGMPWVQSEPTTTEAGE